MKIYAILGIISLLLVAFKYAQDIGHERAEAQHILAAAKHQKEVKEKEIVLRKEEEQRHLETNKKLVKLDTEYNQEQERLMGLIAKEKAEHENTKKALANEKNAKLCKQDCIIRER